MKNKITEVIFGTCLALGIAGHLWQLPKPRWTYYSPKHPDWQVQAGEVRYRWTQFVKHGKISSPGDGYQTLLTDLDTGLTYMVQADNESPFPIGEYHDVLVSGGVIRSGTRKREPFPCKMLHSVSEVPNNFSLANCVPKEGSN